MKKFLLIGLFTFACLSCSDDTMEKSQTCNSKEKIVTKNHVSYSDVLILCQGQANVTRSTVKPSVDIECITNEKDDTLLYVYKKQSGGWTIYASDMRVPAIIAHSDEGAFDDLMKIDGAKLWIQSIAEDIAAIKQVEDDKLNFSLEEIELNRTFWQSISCPNELFKEDINLSSTRSVGNSSLIPKGHYELEFSESFIEAYDTIPRLTTTNWAQGHPYNSFCPYKSDYSERSPAGCAAIAGAQMLYFLHYKLGVPATAPSEAYCNGNNVSYSWAQTNYTSNIWDSMATNAAMAAPLIADVGRRVNMTYGDDGSSAYTSNLVNSVFAPYGISCTYSVYNETNLRNSLQSGIPVILSASSMGNDSDPGTTGHAFIADRYIRNRIKTVNQYGWVYESSSNNDILPFVPRKIEYTYSSPVIGMIGINWGWGALYNIYTDNSWYTLTGDWINELASERNWNINRHMIYNFSCN